MRLSLDFHLATVQRLSSLKMSAYHIHLSDDSGYALPSSVFPNLTSPHLALPLEDWETLVETAAKYHVELIPEIDLPGHSAWIGKQLPELLGVSASDHNNNNNNTNNNNNDNKDNTNNDRDNTNDDNTNNTITTDNTDNDNTNNNTNKYTDNDNDNDNDYDTDNTNNDNDV